MARLYDVPKVIRAIGLREYLRRVAYETLDDNLFLFAGSLAYAWLLALFPFVIFILHLVPFFPRGDHETLSTDASVLMHALLPDKLADAIWTNGRHQIEQAVATRNVQVLVISMLASLWVASGGITVTMAALDKCYELQKVRVYYARRPMAFFLTAMMALLVAAMIVLLPIGAIFKRWVFEKHMGEVSYWAIWTFDIVRAALAFAAAMLVVGVLYHFGPAVKRVFRPVTPGSVFCVSAWLLLGLAFKEYVNQFSGSRYEETYGAAGWVVILLVILYLDALVLLIGAEINSEIDFEILKVPRGSRNFRIVERNVEKLRKLDVAEIPREMPSKSV
jgi:membrane protein